MAPNNNNKVSFHNSRNVRLNCQFGANTDSGQEEEDRRDAAMNFLLGKKASKADATPSQAIIKLKEMESMLAKKQDYLEAKIQKELAAAVQNASSNKRAALIALKRKHRLEEQLKQIDGTLATVEMQREALEQAATNVAVLASMKTAAEALKMAHRSMDVDKAQDVMDDIAELQDAAREVADVLATAAPSSYDDDDLEKELEELEQLELNAKVTKVPKLPAVPTTQLPSTSDRDRDKDADLNKLKAWAQ